MSLEMIAAIQVRIAAIVINRYMFYFISKLSSVCEPIVRR